MGAPYSRGASDSDVAAALNPSRRPGVISGMTTRRLFLFSSLAFGLAACGGGTSSSTGEAPAPTGAPAAGADSSETRPPTSGPIVTVLGDSITAGLGLPAADALPAQLQAALNRSGVQARVRGAGVSGDTLEAGQSRLDFSVGEDTALAVVALGGNDVLRGTPVERVRASLEAILARLEARGIPVVLVGVAPTARASGDYGREFTAAYAAAARSHDVAGFVPNLLDGIGADLRQADGLHPNAAGVRRIAARLAPVVAEALPAGTSAGEGAPT